MLRSLLGSLLLPLLLFSNVKVSAQTWQWATRAGSRANDRIQAAATDASGNVYVIGTFSDTANIYGTLLASAGGTDVFVAKLLPIGIWDWAVRLGGRGNDAAGDIVLNAGALYVTGAFSDTATYGNNRRLISAGATDVFVGRLAANSGAWTWAVGAGGTGADGAASLAVASTGTIFLTGQFSSPTMRVAANNLTNAAAGTADAFLARLAVANGAWQGAIRAGGSGNDQLGRVLLDNRGSLVVLGTFDSPSLLLSGTTLTNAGTGTNDAFVGKLGPTAVAWQWATRVGGAGNEAACDLVLDATNNAYVAGAFESDSLRLGTTRLVNAGADSTADMFVAKINASGAWQWAVRGGSAHQETAHRLLADGTDLLVTGELGGSFDAGLTRVTNSGPFSTRDIYLARLTNTGRWVDVARTGGSGNDSPSSLTKGSATGTVVLTGNFASQRVSFGGVSVTNNDPAAATTDFFAALFDARTLTAVAEEDASELSFDFWPNPAQGMIHLKGFPKEVAAVTLLDALGRVVLVQPLVPGTERFDLELKAVPAGTYFIRVGKLLQRLVVE